VFPDGLVADLERPTAIGIHCVVAASIPTPMNVLRRMRVSTRRRRPRDGYEQLCTRVERTTRHKTGLNPTFTVQFTTHSIT